MSLSVNKNAKALRKGFLSDRRIEMKKILLMTAAFVLVSAGAAFAQEGAMEGKAEAASEAPAPERVRAEIINAESELVGEATFTQGPIGVLATIKLKDMPPGPHGMHIHTVGMCDHADHFKGASGHVNPGGKEHGYLNENGPEKGDLPNIIVGEDGRVEVELFLPQFNISGEGTVLMDEDGSALMIHESPDDHKTQPIGGSGARIACGLIQNISQGE